jgi:Excalibur calcium-binding domain
VKRAGVIAVTATVLFVAPASAAVDGTGAVPRFPNCKALNAKYPHGVGRVGARDKTSGTPVTTFKRSNALYEANRGRDRDKDGIACEKA